VRVRTIILAAAIVAVAAVALGRLHPFGDPRADRLQGPDADTRTLLQTSGIPAPARKVLVDNCADCHSNATHWRFYARVAPFSWLVERDVIEGRKHMNLSHWSELTPEKRDQLESKILLETKKGSMPPLQYRLVHWGNGISADDMKALSMLVPQGQTGASNASLQGDAARGQVAFNKRCTGCHNLDANRDGPRLRGVYGRTAASNPVFSYSAALKKSGITWNDATLDQWLKDTDAMIPGNDMEFRVKNAQERADLIAFLRQSK
jgi:cytochrome c